jgi:hypothetical protein
MIAIGKQISVKIDLEITAKPLTFERRESISWVADAPLSLKPPKK